MAYGSSRVGAYEPIKRKSKKSKNKNNGGILGGAEYLVNSALAGIGGVGEGIVDLFSAAGAAISGDLEYAKYVFKDNVVGDWHEDITEEYNPDAAWKFGGDVAHGLGQSSWLLLNLIPGANWVGTATFGAGMVGQGISGAAEQTGDVGLKEVAYGVTTAAIETGLEVALGGMGKVAKTGAGAFAKATGKQTLRSIASSSVRKGLASKLFSAAAGEFAEEFVSEYADTFLQRAYQINPDAEYSLQNALYAGAVGAVSGGISAGSVDVANTVSNRARGARIIKNGNSQTLVNTANLVADKLAGSGTNFKKAPEWVKTLRGEVDAYNKLVSKGQQNSASAETILGEMQASLYFAETQAIHSGLVNKIQNESEENRAALAEYINRSIDKTKRRRDYTAADIAADTDEIATQLGIMNMAGASFFNFESAMADQAQESAIEGVVKKERAEAAKRAEAEADKAANEVPSVFAESDESKSVTQATNPTIARAAETQAAVKVAPKSDEAFAAAQARAAEARTVDTVQRAESGVQSEGPPAVEAMPEITLAEKIKEGVPTISKKIEAVARRMEIGDKTYKTDATELVAISRTFDTYIESGMNESEAIRRAVDENLTRITTTEGGRITTIRTKATIRKAKKSIISAYAQKFGISYEGSEMAHTADEGTVEGEAKEPSINSAKSEAESGEPKINEAKESLTDEQRAERAKKRAEAWIEWEKKTAPSAKELNKAREYVKGFDNLENSRRLAIIRHIRSAEGVKADVVKGIANIMAVNPKSDLEFRFAEGIGNKGLTTTIGKKTVIVINSKADTVAALRGTIAHELLHYLETREGYKDFADYVMSKAKPEVIKKHRQGYIDGYERLGNKYTEADLDSEVAARLLGEALQSERFLKRYAERDKKFIQKAAGWVRELASKLKKKNETAEQKAAADAAIKVADEYAQMMNVLLQQKTVKEAAGGVKYSVAGTENEEINSIKEQLKKSNDTLASMTPIKSKEPPRTFKNAKEAVEWAVEVLRSSGELIQRKGYGEVVLDEKRLKNGLSYLKTDMEKVAFSLVPKVIKNGIEIGRHSKHKDRIYDTVTFASPVTVGDITGYMAVVIREEGKNYFKLHRVFMPDGSLFEFQETKRSNAETAGLHNANLSPTNVASNNSISQKSDLSTPSAKKYDLADDTAYLSAVKSGDMETAPKNKAKTKAEVVDENRELREENRELREENRELKASQQATQNKMRGMLEKLAREEAEYQKRAKAEVFAKDDVALAVKSIESWTQEEALSLAKGFDLKGMTKAKREDMISQIYIALHEQSARGESGPGSIAVKILAAKIAAEYIDSAAIRGEDGKVYHFNDIYDEATVNGFKQELTDLLYGEFSNMGKATANAEFLQKIRVMNESFRKERLNEAMLSKDAKNVAYQAQEIKKLAEKQKRDGVTESLGALTKVLGSIVDAKGNIRVGVIDKAMGEISVFLEGEKLKIDSERGQLSEEAKMTEIADVVDEELQFMVEEFRRIRAGREGKVLTAEEMRLAGNILRGMKTSIERYNKEFINGHWVDIDTAASGEVEDLISMTRLANGKEYKTKVGQFLGQKVGKGVNEIYFYKILSPENVLGALESYRDGGLLQSMYHSVRVARQKAGHLAVQMKKPFAEFLDDKENRWEGSEEQGGKSGKQYSYRDKLNVRKINVNGAELTLGEAIYLLMLTKRKESHAGLMENGYIVYDENNQRRLKVKLEDVGRAGDLIYSQLDGTDRKFLQMAEEFFNKTSGKVKHDADMKIFGYSNIIDGYYVPMIRDRYSRMQGVTDARQGVMSIVTVYNKSFNQNLIANAKALEGKNIMSIINDHADGLAEYSEMYLPLKAFDRVYNKAVAASDGEVRSIREVLNNEVWNGTEQYLKDLFKDVQGQRERRDNVVDTIVGKLRAGWVNSVLGANIKVVATQTTSLGAATQIIEPRYITKAASVIAKKDISELRERAYKYSDIIEARSFDMGALKAQGNIEKVSKLGEKSGFLIGWMDERVCLEIFHAAEIKVEELTGEAIGTEKNAEKAAKIADEAIYTTQAMSDATERSALQRSTSEIAKLFSMFTSDTVKNLSHTWGNLMKYQAHKARADAGDAKYQEMLQQDKTELGRSVRTLAITGIMLGLITQAFKYLYAKEEEEPEDKAKDFAIDIVSSTLNIFPIVSDIVDKLFFDYDISMNVLDVANDTIETVGKGGKLAGKAMAGEYVSTNDVAGATLDIVMSGAQLFGIPVKPVERTITGLMRRFVPSAIYGYDSMFSNPSYTADLKAAVESGDDALAEHILNQLYKSEVNGTYTSAELEEVARLYSLTNEEGKHYNVLPQKIGTEVNGVKLSSAQRKKFMSIYSGASAEVNKLIGSSYYTVLTDEQRAKAIKNIYSMYYDRAAAEVVGKEWSNAVAYSYLTSNYTALFAAQAYKSGLAEQKDASGKKITVSEQFVEYAKNLGLPESDYVVITYANGVRNKTNRAAFIAYINSLSLSPEIKAQIAERLGFEIKDGVVREKEE